MHDLIKISLDNEMDLILAHKRSMKLAELADLSLSAQTTFATAVSEVSRNIIENGKRGNITLSVQAEKHNRYIVATLKDNNVDTARAMDGLEYAKRLVNKFNVSTKGTETFIELFYYISSPLKLDKFKIDEWRSLFRNEPPISPYDELKRKNEQLQELAEKIIKSETQYKLLTNSLPIIIFSLDKNSQLLFANDWLSDYSGYLPESLDKTKWKTIVHPDDYHAFLVILQHDIVSGAIAVKTQTRLRNGKSGDFLWHQISLFPYTDKADNVLYWNGFMVDIHAQKLLEETLRDNIELTQAQQKLKENQVALEGYIDELNRSNFELQQFAFIASHDLQEPVRKILFYSDFLLESYVDKLDKKGATFLTSMQSAAQRMRTLIQDILSFSRVDKDSVAFADVDLNEVANAALQDMEIAITEKQAEINIASLPTIQADSRMMMQVFENIIGNAIKYCAVDVKPVITIQCKADAERIVLSFTDNGIGIQEQYLEKIFTLFQRLHGRESYEGTGLGLAICKRIIEIHHGKIWAQRNPEQGITILIALPITRLLNNKANAA